MIKAVWLTNVDSQVLYSRDRLAVGLQQLHSLGFNTIYPAVWQRGFTLYPSSIAEIWTGASVMPNSPFVGRDFLAEIIELATPLNMRVIPWFEYGLMLPPKSPIAVKFPELISTDRSGNRQRTIIASGKQDPNVWLNPCMPQVQDFLVDLITDLVQRYQVAGIQLDDHFGFPQELGYDTFTQDLFKQQRGKIAPIDHSSSVWLDWGCNIVTELLDRISRSVKHVRSSSIISVSPNPLRFSRTNYLADWQAWQKMGSIDELVLQVYRDNLLAFTGELNKPEIRSIRQQIPTIIGILTGLKTKPVDDKTIESQIAATLKAAKVDKSVREARHQGDRGFAGTAYFSYETVFHQQLSPSIVARSQEGLDRVFG
jgi:uncharacterized lipoprotein YddW (UPF0748 family)